MSIHRSPVRRPTRQRTGNKVSGQGTGSTCKIVQSHLFTPGNNDVLLLEAKVDTVLAHALFVRDIAVIGTGAYLFSELACDLSGELSWATESRARISHEFTQHIGAGRWERFGFATEISISQPQIAFQDVQLSLKFSTSGSINLYGLIIGAINDPYLIKEDVYRKYCMNLSSYLPETLYIDPTNSMIQIAVRLGNLLVDGKLLICKSCNRCSRFLPIDIEHERNDLGYSNHCVSRAPCIHPSFSQFKVISGDTHSFSSKLKDEKIVSHHGFQLECRTCKKLFVNSDLNGLRSHTQHREDSLRRRALEVLADTLLEHGWIYHVHRTQAGKEFDVHIWDKFGRKCFNCGTAIASANGKDMQLDHTMPLAYLWPLDGSATCLCPKCNGEKSDSFPVDFYKAERLPELAQITGLPTEILRSRAINRTAVGELFKKIVWFFDEFLANNEYQKVRVGKKAADNIVRSLHNVLHASDYNYDLVSLYVKETGRVPTTVTAIE